MKLLIYQLHIMLCLLVANSALAMATRPIVVSKDGKGHFTSIQAAINSLSDSSGTPRTILIKNGIYTEKVYIEKHNIILQGESMDKTIITQAIARDYWRCLHNDDWGVATMNIDGNDITLINLTIRNTYGKDYPNDVVLDCPKDSISPKKKITKGSHQMALRTMNGTRLQAYRCHFIAYGGDTVSPWQTVTGMFYFKDCVMEGGVDFYCPRGIAMAEGCTFVATSGTAAIWHDGSGFEDAKTVLKHCTFKGYNQFKLGRYHRDAQFYLLYCTFDENMADEDIYLVPTSNVLQWGRRIYYYDCHRTGGDYAWHKNNLNTAKGTPQADRIDINWVFQQQWKPGNIKL
ncbi:pectinesterase [Chitinophaga skermanii]|uniref:Pectinesterase n=1 Tax=Chitinophaga skermanii TaxID=331697 RepID=A0A327QM35_9BACT|nr:pectinesterase family protein [Chitinophaga skermanii]RAJ05321.1 pectinesterase [Chitinophaga skermanii]